MPVPQPYRLDVPGTATTVEELQQQLASLMESADAMFEILFRDQGASTAVLGDTLESIDDLTTTGIMVNTAPTVVTRTITAGTGISITNGNGVAGNPVIRTSGRYQLVTNGFELDPELVFVLGDVLEVWVP